MHAGSRVLGLGLGNVLNVVTATTVLYFMRGACCVILGSWRVCLSTGLWQVYGFRTSFGKTILVKCLQVKMAFRVYALNVFHMTGLVVVDVVVISSTLSSIWWLPLSSNSSLSCSSPSSSFSSSFSSWSSSDHVPANPNDINTKNMNPAPCSRTSGKGC